MGKRTPLRPRLRKEGNEFWKNTTIRSWFSRAVALAGGLKTWRATRKEQIRPGLVWRGKISGEFRLKSWELYFSWAGVRQGDGAGRSYSLPGKVTERGNRPLKKRVVPQQGRHPLERSAGVGNTVSQRERPRLPMRGGDRLVQTTHSVGAAGWGHLPCKPQ